MEKYIAANLPGEIAKTCENNKLSNHVLLDRNGAVVGFRIVRKEGEIADGKRLHVSRYHAGKGFGGLMVKKSEQYANRWGVSRWIYTHRLFSKLLRHWGIKGPGYQNHSGVCLLTSPQSLN